LLHPVDFCLFLAPSFVAKLITGITGTPCSTSLAGGSISVQSTVALTARFVYVTAASNQAIKTTESHIAATTPKYSNLILMAKNECETILRLTL
jgi:hypothetical protein